MGLFAALMTYLVAAALLVGGAVAGLSVLLAPSDVLSARSPPPLVRAADRKSTQPARPEAAPQVRIVAPASANQPPSRPSGPAVTPAPAAPSEAKNAAKAQAAAAPPPVKKKRIAKKPAPLREADTTTLGYGPSEPQRRFIFPLDPGW